MYEEKYRKKKRNARPRRTFGQWLGLMLMKLVALALTLALLLAGLLFILPPALFLVEPDDVELALSDSLPHTCLNVLLLGTDQMRDGIQRSDAMIIASIGFGTFKLTSVLRDTVVEIPGHGRTRLNAAYAYGGAELVMRTLNQNFGLNLMHYVHADFVSLVRIVDAIGGIQVSVTERERNTVNDLLNANRDKIMAMGYAANAVAQSGENVRLDGIQALAFSRIRSSDSDFERTGRQRAVVMAIARRIKKGLWNPFMLRRLARAVAGSVDTNLPTLQILSLGEKALMSGLGGNTLRLPTNDTIDEKDYKLNVTDFTANHDAFVKYVYGGGR